MANKKAPRGKRALARESLAAAIRPVGQVARERIAKLITVKGGTPAKTLSPKTQERIAAGMVSVK